MERTRTSSIMSALGSVPRIITLSGWPLFPLPKAISGSPPLVSWRDLESRNSRYEYLRSR